jgi:hypothetical protein
MHTYRYFLSLRLWHPSLDLSIVTGTLGLSPKYTDTAGKARVRKGKVLGKIANESYWTHEFDLGSEAEQDLEDCLLIHADQLMQHKALFDSICSTGGGAEFFIGFMLESFNCGFGLSPELQNKCAALNLGLSFDIYDSDKHAVAAV